MLRSERDAVLGLLWMLTYTLVLIGTRKYKYPLISPVTQIFISSLEFSVLFQLMLDGAMGWNHIWISYLYWTFIEIAIIAVQIKKQFIPKKYVKIYLMILVASTIIMCYLVAYRRYGFFCNYFNTFVGEIIWLHHIKKREYPMNPIVLALFMCKFIADTIGVSVYWDFGTWVIRLLCVLLPMLDFMFIHEYFQRVANGN